MNSTIDLKQAQFLDEPDGSRYIRLPRPGERCRYSGLSRTGLSEICVPCAANDFKPQVHSKLLRKKYARRGIRLVHLGSLMEFIGGLPTQQGGPDDE